MRIIVNTPRFFSATLLKLLGTATLIAILSASSTPLYADDPVAPTTPAATTTTTTPAATTTTDTAATLAPDSVTGLSAPDAVALGVNEFVKQYTTKSTDNSPAGIKTALDVFYQFQRALNRTATLALPKNTQHLIGDVREVYSTAAEANISAEEAMDKGGTLYADIRARAAADREVALARMITTLQTPWSVPKKGKRAFEPAFAELQATIDTLPFPDQNLPNVWAERYKETHAQLLSCVPKLHNVLLQLPDNADMIILKALQQELTPFLEELGPGGNG